MANSLTSGNHLDIFPRREITDFSDFSKFAIFSKMLPILLILLVDYPCVATPLRSFGPAGSAAPAPAWTPPSWRGDNFGQCIHFFPGCLENANQKKRKKKRRKKCESRMMFDDQNAIGQCTRLCNRPGEHPRKHSCKHPCKH